MIAVKCATPLGKEGEMEVRPTGGTHRIEPINPARPVRRIGENPEADSAQTRRVGMEAARRNGEVSTSRDEATDRIPLETFRMESRHPKESHSNPKPTKYSGDGWLWVALGTFAIGITALVYFLVSGR